MHSLAYTCLCDYHTHSTLWLTICGQLVVGVGGGTALVSTYPDVLLAVL